jgi:hypothetical protein
VHELLDVKDIVEVFVIVRAFLLLNVRRLLGRQPAQPYPMAAGQAVPGYPSAGYGYQYQQQYPAQYQQAPYVGQQYPAQPYAQQPYPYRRA